MDRQDIKNRQKLSKYKQKELAEIIGSNPSQISKFYNGKEKLSFESMLKLCEILYPEEVIGTLTTMIKKDVNTSPQILRHAMEYAAFNENVYLLEYLVNREKESQNILNREFANAYDLLLKHIKGEISHVELSSLSGRVNATVSETRFFVLCLEMYGVYLDLRTIILDSLVKRMEIALNEITDIFLKNYYTFRFNLITGNVNLYNYNLTEARKKYQENINTGIFSKRLGHVYHVLGQTYMYSDKDKCIHYHEKAIEVYEKLNEQGYIINVKDSLNIAYNIYGEFEKVKPHDESFFAVNEMLHRAARKGNKDQAEMLIKMINEDDLNPRNKGFFNCYKGILYNDLNYIYQSVMYFNNCGYKFYSIIPIAELIKRGVPEVQINALFGNVLNKDDLKEVI